MRGRSLPLSVNKPCALGTACLQRVHGLSLAAVWTYCKADWFLRPSERWKKLMPGKQLHQGPGQSCVEQWSLHFHCTCCHAQEAHITFTQDNPVLSSGGHCAFIALAVRPRRYRSPPPRAPRSRSPPREPRTILCWSLHFHGVEQWSLLCDCTPTCCNAQEENPITFSRALAMEGLATQLLRSVG